MHGRLLIIEDERKIADTLQGGLCEQGFDASTAYDGYAGLRAFDSGVYDLIILDVNLPGINGLDLCRVIRKTNEQIPVIMLTSMSQLKNKVDGYDAGADDYITKPFEFRELLLKIRAVLKRTLTQPAHGSRVLKAADLILNLDTKEAQRGDTMIRLTAKEFQLLEYLLRNKNRVVSRADLAINVWDIDFDTNTNVIDVYINYVRNKVDKPFGQKLIQTQVGMGYILKSND
jgi:two-component system copper resistance phosphate regulon response regulator CusR